MFTNIGAKIKTLAKIVCWIGIALSVILGLIVATRFVAMENLILSFAVFLLYAGIGSLASWLGSFALYGFGELIENSRKTVLLQKKQIEFYEHILKNNQKIPTENKWRCEKCGLEVSGEYTSCPFCEYVEKKDHMKETNIENDI